MAALRPSQLLRAAVLVSSALSFSTVSLVSVGQPPSLHLPLPKATKPAVRTSYGELPLSFEANRGQARKDARFLAHGDGFSLALKSTEAIFTLLASDRRAANPVPDMGRSSRDRRALQRVVRSDVLRMQLVGARMASTIMGQSLLPGKTNYLFGRDPKQWLTDIPTYAKVQYRGVYPGVDLVYYGNHRQLEYDFVIAPKANPSQIALKFQGAKHLAIDKAGELVVALKSGSVRWHKPVVYQEIGGKRKSVAGGFVLKSNNNVTFAVARYDIHRPLVIDPVFAYSIYIGGANGATTENGIAIDADGNAYIGGETDADDLVGATNPPFPGTRGAAGYITKLDPTGTKLIYSTYVGRALLPEAITIDSAGQAYMVGLTIAHNFPVINGAQQTFAGRFNSGFLLKLNSAGNGLLYSTYFGGIGSSGDTNPNCVAVGPDGTVYIAGSTQANSLPMVAPFQSSNPNFITGFIARFDTNLVGPGSLVYSSYFGGSDIDEITGIAVDSSGRFYVTGDTASSNFPTINGYQKASNGNFNAFVSAFVPDGSRLFYSTYLGGTHTDDTTFGSNSRAVTVAWGIAVDAVQHAYITGRTNATDFPIRGDAPSVYGGNGDAFVAKIDCGAQGDASLVYSSYVGGPDKEEGWAIAIDAWGNAYIDGTTNTTINTQINSTVFVAKIGVRGTLLFRANQIGAGNLSRGSIAVDPLGAVFVAGRTQAHDFPVTPGAVQTHVDNILDFNAFVFHLPTFFKMDINNDGMPDLLFQNAINGRLAYWTMNGDRETSVGFLTPSIPGKNWQAVGSADLDGNGTTDLVFQNSFTGDIAYWLMSGTTETAFGNIEPRNPGATWQVVGVADINRDGYPDLVFQNRLSEDLYVWYMHGTKKIAGAYLTPKNPGSGWKAVAVGDLNNDGQADIVFQNAYTGDLYVWYLHSGTFVSGGYLNPANPGIGWKVAGLAELNGNTRPELLFQNTFTGQLAYWVLDGRNLVNVGLPQPANPGGPEWQLAGAH